jgi:hypothetical protein
MIKAHKSWLRGATVRPSRFVGRATLSAESEVANSVRRRRLQPRNALGRNALATGVSVGILTSADDIPLPCCHDRSLTILLATTVAFQANGGASEPATSSYFHPLRCTIARNPLMILTCRISKQDRSENPVGSFGHKRQVTTALLSALNALGGTVIGRSMQRRPHQEFIHFVNAIVATARRDFPR